MTKRFNRVGASGYLWEKHAVKCAPRTLAKYAVVGGGPIFQRSGRYPNYTDQNLDAWATSRLSKEVRSTSELRAPLGQDTSSAQPRDRRPAPPTSPKTSSAPTKARRKRGRPRKVTLRSNAHQSFDKGADALRDDFDQAAEVSSRQSEPAD